MGGFLLLALVVAFSLACTSCVRCQGIFGPRTPIATVGVPMCLVLGDVDDDLDMDIIVASYSSSAVKLFLNSGTGTFTAGADIANVQVNSASGGIVLANIDADTKPDVVVASDSPRAVNVYANMGGGLFSTSPVSLSIHTFGNPRGVVAVDLNSDLVLDVVVVNWGSPSSLSWHANLGGLSFGAFAQVDASHTSNPQQAVGALVNDDTMWDLVVAHGTASLQVAVYLNVANGTSFTLLSIETGASSGCYGVAVLDIDADGRTDIVALANSANGARYYLNDVTLTFTARGWINLGGLLAPESIWAGHVDMDARADVLTASTNSFEVAYFANAFAAPGAAPFGSKVSISQYGVGNSAGMAAGLVDGDTVRDIVEISRGNDALVWYKGAIPPSPPPSPPPPPPPPPSPPPLPPTPPPPHPPPPFVLDAQLAASTAPALSVSNPSSATSLLLYELALVIVGVLFGALLVRSRNQRRFASQPERWQHEAPLEALLARHVVSSVFAHVAPWDALRRTGRIVKLVLWMGGVLLATAITELLPSLRDASRRSHSSSVGAWLVSSSLAAVTGTLVPLLTGVTLVVMGVSSPNPRARAVSVAASSCVLVALAGLTALAIAARQWVHDKPAQPMVVLSKWGSALVLSAAVSEPLAVMAVYFAFGQTHRRVSNTAAVAPEYEHETALVDAPKHESGTDDAGYEHKLNGDPALDKSGELPPSYNDVVKAAAPGKLMANGSPAPAQTARATRAPITARVARTTSATRASAGAGIKRTESKAPTGAVVPRIDLARVPSAASLR